MKRIFESIVSTSFKRCVFAFALLLTVMAIFETLPAVQHARALFPEDFSHKSCSDVLKGRPWYGQINTWFWFWLISTPVIICSLKPDAPQWQKSLRPVIAVALGYVSANLGAHLGMEIRNAPFHGEGVAYINNVLVTSEADKFKFECFDIADNAKYVFAFLFGWIPALVYTGWWEIVWHQYHKRKTKLMNKTFKRDWVSTSVAFSSIAIPALLLAWIVARSG